MRRPSSVSPAPSRAVILASAEAAEVFQACWAAANVSSNSAALSVPGALRICQAARQRPTKVSRKRLISSSTMDLTIVCEVSWPVTSRRIASR